MISQAQPLSNSGDIQRDWRLFMRGILIAQAYEPQTKIASYQRFPGYEARSFGSGRPSGRCSKIFS